MCFHSVEFAVRYTKDALLRLRGEQVLTARLLRVRAPLHYKAETDQVT